MIDFLENRGRAVFLLQKKVQDRKLYKSRKVIGLSKEPDIVGEG